MTHNTLTQADLNQFTGDLVRFRHSLFRNVIYTPGVKYVAETGGAYWLIDAIASHMSSRKIMAQCRSEDYAPLYVWTLRKEPSGSWILYAKTDMFDWPEPKQRFDYSDFPLNKIDIWAAFDGSYWSLYLPSEH